MTPTSTTNKQTNKREIRWQYDTYKTPCQNENQKKKKIDRIRYIFTFRALGLIVPGADQYRNTLLEPTFALKRPTGAVKASVLLMT